MGYFCLRNSLFSFIYTMQKLSLTVSAAISSEAVSHGTGIPQTSKFTCPFTSAQEYTTSCNR